MEHPIVYPTVGLTSEVGEVASVIKKIFRDKKGKFSKLDKQLLKEELGDVLWYLTQICTELDLSLEDIAEENLNKLFKRYKIKQ